MGLPELNITFQKNATTVIQRSENGIVLAIVRDETDTSFSVKEYSKKDDLASGVFTDENYNALLDAFKSKINKLIVVRIALLDDMSVATELIKNLSFDWCCVISDALQDHDDLVTYLKSRNAVNSRRVKAVVYKATAPDDEHIVNFTNTDVTYVDDSAVTLGHLFVLRLAALFASMSIERSSTYFELMDLESVSEVASANPAIDQGELILINDEGKIRIGRGVNSLTNLGETKTEDMKSILIIEAMDLIYYDIHTNYKENFISQYKNNYDNQALFISEVNGYFKDLARENVLDSNYSNVAMVDIEAQRKAWIDDGVTEASLWTDQAVKNNTYKNELFLAGNIKILNAMEDLNFGISMA